MQFIIVTGISGSGKSIALSALEDAGYYCVDNLPPPMLATLALELSATSGSTSYPRIAISCDIRAGASLHQLPAHIQTLKNSGHEVKVLFLTASTPCLVKRYSETRRRHPLNNMPQHLNASLIECIAREREFLEASGIEALGHVIDTSELRPGVLGQWLDDVVDMQPQSLLMLFESFAFKQGVPLDADLVFDVRCLPNPHYEPALRGLTGQDPAVQTYLQSFSMTTQMVEDIKGFVTRWLPSYQRENRSYLTIAIGCTGGQHRSVYCVETLAAWFRLRQPVLVRHREQHPLSAASTAITPE